MIIRKLLASEKCTLLTLLTVEEVTEKIAGELAPKQYPWLFEMVFKGSVNNDSFEIRQIGGRSEGPRVTGHMRTKAGKTLIGLDIETGSIRIILLLWSFLGCVFVLAMFFQTITNFNSKSLLSAIIFAFICFLMIGAGWLAHNIYFKAECRKLKQYLADLLEIEEIVEL